MSIRCSEQDSFEARIKVETKLRNHLVKKVKLKAKPRINSRLKAFASLQIIGFTRGGGVSESFSSNNFGAVNFGAEHLTSGPILPKLMRGDTNIGLNSVQQFTKKPPRSLPSQLVDIESAEIKNGGWDAIPDSVYDPATSNNHSYTHVNSPQFIHRPIARFKSSSRFRSTLGNPLINFDVNFKSSSRFLSKFFEKIKGHVEKLNAFDFSNPYIQRLYPEGDESVTSEISFVDKIQNSSGIYRSVNEGVFTGSVMQNQGTGYLMSDDSNTYITPSSISSDNISSYKCSLTTPNITPVESLLFLRATTPLFTNETDQPPTYDIYNILFLDPSGNKIAKYKDVTLKGVSDYNQSSISKIDRDWFTIVTEPLEFYAGTGVNRIDYPILGEPSGYTLSFDVKSNCKFEPFDDGFNEGFEEGCDIRKLGIDLASHYLPANSVNNHLGISSTPLSTRTQGYGLNLNNSIRFSALEIVNAGLNYGIIEDSVLNLHMMPQPTGQRLERILSPTKVLTTSYTNNIYPTGIVNTWVSSADTDGLRFDNTSDEHAGVLVDRLANRFVDGWITLEDVNPVSASGKLQLLYKHSKPKSIKQPTGGSFLFGQKYGGSDFGTAKVELVPVDDSFYVVEEITLRLSARKAAGTDDYPIDVVGYSDDGVLAITSQTGGFLQNKEVGSGTVPLGSGFLPIDDLGISTNSMSDKYAYFQEKIIKHGAGDHYLIPTSTLVNSTSFKTYDIPLKVYNDEVILGRSKDYSMSTYFEALYLDIYPIPSGASIQRADLIIKYKPAGSIPLTTAGYLSKQFYSREGRLYPDSKQDTDVITNSSATPLSLIENIPHGYTPFETTLKTNYSRRWRGNTGNVDTSPFDPVSFDFSFERSVLDQPFLLGYFDFNKISGNVIQDSNGHSIISGVMNSDISSSLTRNIGLRFNSDSLFDYSVRNYKTIDWCGSGHELEGKILDAYDNALRVSGVNGYLDFGNTPTASGFSIYTRFSPDSSISGVGYNGWDNGVIFGKWDNGQNLEYALGYENGHLCAYARSEDSSVIKVIDPSPYTSYQYPLSTLVTYNQNHDYKLRLYAYNEISSGVSILRNESSAFVMHSGNSNLSFGYSAGSGVGINAFIHEIGISDVNASGSANLVEGTANRSIQEDTVADFFASQAINFWDGSDNLWKYVDEKTDSWKLGAFKYCSFSPDFDVMSVRNGRDFIYHNFYNHGQSYADLTDISFPAAVKASGLAYHSQIENDMLRVQLSGREDRFYAVAPRICKNFPRSYLFAEDSLLVNTIMQHICDQDIVWPDGKRGVKVIVSLYTPRKESPYTPTTNYGLISRDVHYVTPEDCWLKLRSKFTLGNYNDSTSEPWAYFDKTISKKEFSENYFARDIDEMFVQYDLVYPSGSYEESKVIIHSLDISLDNILLNKANENERLNVYTSGEKYRDESLNLSWAKGSVRGVIAAQDFSSSNYGVIIGDTITLNDLSVGLYTSGNVYTNIDTSGINLYASGYTYDADVINLYGMGSKPDSGVLNIYSFGWYANENNLNNPFTLYSDGFYANAEHINGTLNIYSVSINDQGNFYSTSSASLSHFILADPPATEFPITTFDTISFYTVAPALSPINVQNSINLYTTVRKVADTISDSVNMYLYHEPIVNKKANQLESFLWNGNNFGFEIYVDDNQYASIPANDEIRGVNTMCYGNCNSSANLSCVESDIITHDTLWYSPDCVDGGVIRPYTVYSNSEANAFGTDAPYDRHYYGIRKFTSLIPHAPYTIKITGQSGGSEILEVPREVSEWNYGKSETPSGVITPEVNYSGIRILESLTNRSSGNNFGKSVKVVGDMLAVGVPNSDSVVGVDDLINSDTSSRLVENHGKIYVYRRNPAPSGYDWSNQDDQSQWHVEQEIVLPTGWRRDYFFNTVAQFTDDTGEILPFTGTIRNWLNSGEGRELGYSVDATKVGDKEIIVAGGPGCKWTRTFAPVSTTKVSIGLMIFNDELETNSKPWQNILNELKDRDILYRYFADPPVEFDIKIMILEPHLGSQVPIQPSEEFLAPKPDFVSKNLSTRHWNKSTTSQAWIDADATMLAEMKKVFHETFPLSSTALHSGIPPLLGIFIDDSVSLGAESVGYYTNGFKGAVNKFIDYYKSYSYNNGLLDYAGLAAEGYTQVTLSDQELNWVDQSIACLKDVTDLDKLNNANKATLIANNLGTFNSNASEFNNPPPSGGAVYVFEKDNASASFELKQEIRSPITYTDDASDRFGHDVSISEDGNIIVIGSPYSEYAVQVFERNDSHDSELSHKIHQRLPAFLNAEYNKEVQNETFGEAFDLYEDYLEQQNSVHIFSLTESLFSRMSESLKFSFYKSYGISPYSKIKDMTYSDVYADNGGAWSQFYGNYIPTPRLGYSVDTNYDGTLIAIGCPTDSLGERDVTNTWFRYDNNQVQDWQWQNYVNAGCVRLLESRKLYPHTNKVVEFYKYGNLHEDLAEDQYKYLYYDNIKQMLESRGLDYSRTSFAEDVEIPEDAGMAFIITPAIDASSDEVVANIKKWLAKGDRHLVLVADDPRYEGNGRFQKSTGIINSLLEKLDVNMRVYPAKNEREALLQSTNVELNVQKSFKPGKSTNLIGYNGSKLKGYGVGDIRHYNEEKIDLYSCTLPYGTQLSSNGELTENFSDPFAILEKIDLGGSASDANRKLIYREMHNKCHLPIKHEGDLRAEYQDQCAYTNPQGRIIWLSYKRNLAFAYHDHNVWDWGCNPKGVTPVNPDPNLRDEHAPVPMLAAYESVSKKFDVPEVPASERIEQYISSYNEYGVTQYKFGETPYSGVVFSWTANESNYNSLENNIANIRSQSLFFDPPEVASAYGEIDSVLQAKATTPFTDVDKQVNAGFFNVGSEEGYLASEVDNSYVVLLATTFTERKDILLSSYQDANLLFYKNLLTRGRSLNSEGFSCKVAQLGSFTNRSSYTDGYFKSDIAFRMFGLGIDMRDLNVNIDDISLEHLEYDVVWIANTDQMPSDEDILKLKNFLSLGNKKLVITYGQEPNKDEESLLLTPYMIRSANVARAICEKLGVTMRPQFLDGKNKYADKSDNLTQDPNVYAYLDIMSQYAAEGISSSKFTINAPPYGSNGRGITLQHNIVPIEQNQSQVLLRSTGFLSDIETVSLGKPSLNTGITKVTFDVPDHSAQLSHELGREQEDPFYLFRMYFDVISLTEQENEIIRVYIKNAQGKISVDDDNQPITPSIVSNSVVDLIDLDDDGNRYQTNIQFGSYIELKPSSFLKTYQLDFQAPSGSQIELYFHGSRYWNELVENPEQARTTRVVGVSGVRVPLDSFTTISKTPVYDIRVVPVPAQPAYSYYQEFTREISNNSSPYCLENNSEICAAEPPIGYGSEGSDLDIADGPVVVAQQIYDQGGFYAGHNRSRITVISDASLIQGPNILTKEGNTVNDLANFLASLYPVTREFFQDEYYGKQQSTFYPNAYKLISPERSSPSRLVNAFPQNSGLNVRFGGYTSAGLTVDHYADDEGKKNVEIPPGKEKAEQPFDSMLSLMDSVDQGIFRKLPVPPQLPPSEHFATPPFTYNGYTKEEYEQKWYVDEFLQYQSYWSSTSKIQDTYQGQTYVDAGLAERIPAIMRATGFDHLDLDVFNSGYPGDLFGYKVCIHKNKIYVGAPFSPYNSETILPWSGIVSSGYMHGVEVGYNGGAGAVYQIEKVGNTGGGAGSIQGSSKVTSGIPWKTVKKFRPDELGVGFTNLTASEASGIFGNHSYTDDFLQNNAFVSDMFGYDITLDADLMAISAPGHDFEVFFEEQPGEFVNKAFNDQFNISTRKRHDLALQSNRDAYPNSGTAIINNGAVFTYENKINNWGAKTQEWTSIHKLIPQGSGARVENDYFGQSISIYRSNRSDGDYILGIGAKNHSLDSIHKSGAVYTNDAMLRKLRPAFSHPDTYLAGKIFGVYKDKDEYVEFNVTNGNVPDKQHIFEGLVFANEQGEIFIEASGQDFVERGYVNHRPFIKQIRGVYQFGSPSRERLNLYTDGKPFSSSGVLNLFNKAPDRGNVYNSLGLYAVSQLDSSGILNMYASGISKDQSYDYLNMVCSGSISLDPNELPLFCYGLF